jgi:hypothetical protein
MEKGRKERGREGGRERKGGIFLQLHIVFDKLKTLGIYNFNFNTSEILLYSYVIVYESYLYKS